MENQLAVMEEQLKLYNVQLNLRPVKEIQESTVDYSDGIKWSDVSRMNSDWQLTVSGGSEGVSLQTSIKSLADVSSFLANTFQYFNSQPLPRTPNYHIDRSLQVLTVTNRMLRIESVLYSFFQNKKKMAESSFAFTTIPFYDNFTRSVVKRQIIESYFNCMGLLNPLFPKPHFYPSFRNNQHVMLTSAIAAYVTYTQCRHVPAISPPMTRELLGESFRMEAKNLLEDALFEQEPSIYTAATLMFLSKCGLMTLDNSEARLYINMAWRMIVELKPKHIQVLSEITSDTPFSIKRVEAETWRRLFYLIRYLELSLYVLYDGLYDYDSILFDSGIGYPTVLQIEKSTQTLVDAVEAFREVVRVNDCQMTRKDDEIRYRLFSGKLDNVSVNELQRLENQLCNFWKSLPPSFQLSDSPFDYLQMDRIQQCNNPYAIYLHQVYYSYWLGLETRLMEEPSATDLEGTNMDRYDGDRALLLVSICSDAMSKIFHVLFRKLPCNVEMHWMLIAADAMGRLTKSANPEISKKAIINLKQTLAVLKHRVQRNSDNDNTDDNNYSMLKSMLPSVSSSGESISTSTSSSSLAGSEPDSVCGEEVYSATDSVWSSNTPNPYVINLQKAISTHLDHKTSIL